MPLDALPVEFLFRMEARVLPPAAVQPGPQGDRLILGVAAGRFEGPKLRGEIVSGPSSEWATTRADGTLKADVRLVLQTEDGAHVLMTYNGIGTHDADGLCVRTAPLFETGDPRYTWLNAVQAVGVGAPVEGGIGYDVYRIL